MSSATGSTELADLVEAPGAFMRSGPGVVVRKTRRYTLVAEPGGTWAAVELIRLANDDAAAAVVEVQAFLAETQTTTASWWLTERSTPDDVEARLLGQGLELVEDDYLHDGLLATSAPPPGPPDVDARAVADVDEYIAARRVQEEVFGEPPHSSDELASQFELSPSVTFAAWLDGRVAAAARATFTSCGVHLTAGATAPWARGHGAYRALVRARWDAAVAHGTPALAVGAGRMSSPILRRLGFEQVCRFHRLQSTRSDAVPS